MAMPSRRTAAASVRARRPATLARTAARIEARTDPWDPATEPAEDDPAFDCRIHGNRICGPGNSQGVPPGQYRDVQPGITLVNFMLGQ